MSNKLRRQRDLIRKTVDRYVQTTTEDYTKYLEGSPTYITYYRLDDLATKQDSSLENVHSLTGANSPNKYQKILDVVVYGVDAMDISQEINEKGLQSLVNGELIILPDTIKPYPGDFFTFDYDGLEEHLFRIDDVQFDRATPKKFYRVGYNLYPENSDDIFGNLVTDSAGKDVTYTLNYDNVGGVEVAVIKTTDAETAERTKDLIDGMIDRFGTLFYDEDMDLFIFDTPKMNTETPGDDIHLWSPYLQKFIHDNKVLEAFNREILTEYYIVDVNQKSNDFFSNLGYRNSIFRKVETQDAVLTLDNSFMEMQATYDINAIRNLPFGYTSGEYRFVDVFETGVSKVYDSAFHILEQPYHETIEVIDDTHKFTTDELEVGEVVHVNETYVLEGEVFYHLESYLTNKPVDVYKVFNDTNFSISFTELMKDLTGTDAYLETQELFSIIRDYLNGDLVLSDDLINQLNDYYFEISFRDYILMPIVIFIVKKLITDALT